MRKRHTRPRTGRPSAGTAEGVVSMPHRDWFARLRRGAFSLFADNRFDVLDASRISSVDRSAIAADWAAVGEAFRFVLGETSDS